MVSAIRAAMLGRKAGGPDINIPVGTYTHSVIDPSDATCTLEFQSDGDCVVSSGVTPSPTDWHPDAPTVGIGADYDIQFDGGGWLSLSSNRSITQSRSVIGTTQNTYTVEIRNAATLTVVATGNVTLIATVDA